MSTNVVQEGGLGGHMNHLYDDPDLSFGEMKQIFLAAASGELEGTQKVDGQNIFLSYSLARGQAIAARNKTHLKAGGMGAAELAKFFEGRGSLQKAFMDGFQAFEEAVASFSEEEIVGAFGQDGEIYYSAEVIEPANANVIDYDEQVLNIHRSGHGKVDRETANVTATDKDPEMQKSSAVLDAAISKVENTKQSNNFRVQRGSIEKLQSVLDGEHAQRAISKLDSIVGGDAETVGEYVVKKLKPIIQKNVNLPKDKQNMLIQKILGAKGVNKREIKKGLDEKDQAAVEQLISQGKIMLKQIIKPIEMVVHDFAVDALEGMQSIFMLGAQDKKVQNLRDKVAAEIKAIEASGDEASMSKLKSQLEKMKYAEKGLEGITTAAEGFVFDFNGKTYKLTGNYAPINQILGILRYVREGKQMDDSKILKESKSRGIALVPGGFKPPHAGHYQLAAWAGSQPGVDRAIVLVSPKARGPVDAQKSMAIWEVYKSLGANFDVQISGIASPVGATYEYVDNQAQPGDTIFVIKGEKDAGDKRFERMKGRKEGVEVKELTSPTFAGGVSGTQMRGFITSGDARSFQAALPDGLSQEQKNKVWGIASKGGTELQEYLERVVLETINEMDVPQAFSNLAIAASDEEGTRKAVLDVAKPYLEGKQSKDKLKQGLKEYFIEILAEEPEEITEISAVGAGAVEGGSGGAWKNFDEKENEKEKPGGNIMEFKKYSRQDIVEEILLRENIRKVISQVKSKKLHENTKRSKQDFTLRRLIRELILEGGEEIAPHQSTGINVLEDLLKKVVPQIEGDYKTLTTDKAQRDSFRAHILNATENSIAPVSATPERGEEEASTEPVEPIEEIEISVGSAGEQEVDAEEITSFDDDEKLIDIGDIGGGQVEDDTFQELEGEDSTGRNVANMSFQKIEKSIQDSYALLGDEKDQDLFRDYLLTNLKLYFDKFEDELGQGGLDEPTTPEYEEEKGKAKDTESAGGEDTPEGGGEDMDLGGDDEGGEELDLDL
tara:strand:+ start:2118 stop:5135 length:3018 start_codon:yes stop_codon:yes gene_type:complete